MKQYLIISKIHKDKFKIQFTEFDKNNQYNIEGYRFKYRKFCNSIYLNDHVIVYPYKEHEFLTCQQVDEIITKKLKDYNINYRVISIPIIKNIDGINYYRLNKNVKVFQKYDCWFFSPIKYRNEISKFLHFCFKFNDQLCVYHIYGNNELCYHREIQLDNIIFLLKQKNIPYEVYNDYDKLFSDDTQSIFNDRINCSMLQLITQENLRSLCYE